MNREREHEGVGILRQEADDVGQRVHICIGAICNNNCIFCMEDDRQARRDAVEAWSKADVLDVIAANADRNEILFTSGEPTTNRDLPEYIAAAARAGYRVIGVISNGRLFSYAPYAVSLLKAGLNNIIVSIHGPDAKTHDALTRTKGSFEQTLAGLRNLSTLKAAFPLKLQTSTVVTTRNLSSMRAFCDLMADFDIDAHAMNVMMPDGGGRKHMARLMPRYRDVAAYFAGIIDEIDTRVAGRMALVDIPYCATVGLPDSIRGYVERYFHFEADGEFERKAALAGVHRNDSIDESPELFVRNAMDGSSRVINRVTRTYQESWVKTKRPECALCRHDPQCRGVWKAYVQEFGWDEFEPVR
ncbi:MAG TPA: radical SAM protein [Myxococcota bacterium]|nr:radical SAM protein [Myxococcota bacterium]HOC98477.1 radical SAM protein [Myxococcota bacterium]HOH75960.1 radical SAM protein [Myxococcota bacterium]